LLSDKEKSVFKVIGLLLLVGFLCLAGFIWRLGDNRGYAPEQPIPFSHKKHAGDNKIPCMYCHSNADKSRSSTIPSMNVCMNCHSVVKTDSPLIQQVRSAYEKGEAFEWVKVHDLPDFVYFNHKRHIAKGVACQTCHGDVAQMDRITQVKTLNMGFCIDCHRANKAPTDCSTCHH